MRASSAERAAAATRRAPAVILATTDLFSLGPCLPCRMTRVLVNILCADCNQRRLREPNLRNWVNGSLLPNFEECAVIIKHFVACIVR